MSETAGADAVTGPAVEIVEVAWDDPRAVLLRAAMDAEMTARYPATPEQTAASLAVFAVHDGDALATCLAVVDGSAVGHGAMRRLGDGTGTVEIKKIMVLESARGMGVSYAIMGWLLDRARALGAGRAVLQTGWNQPESVHVYERLGFARIPILEKYAAFPTSICFGIDL